VKTALRSSFFAVLLWTCALSFARPAAAHAVGLSRGEYERRASGLAATLTFARDDAATLPAPLAASLESLVHVRAGAQNCRARFAPPAPIDNGGVVVRGAFACARAASALTLDFEGLLGALPSGHRHLARVTDGSRATDAVVYAASPRLDVPAATAGAAPAPAVADRLPALRFVGMGIEHILTGYDHLLFLLGLVLVGSRVGPLLRTVTSFTIAHSITLACAALDWVTIPPAIVEPAIALSIAYVGVENLFGADVTRRWRITFLFGLVHGFGFAGRLRDLALPRAEVPLALFSFNAGVECGQLAAVAFVVPIVWWVERKGWLRGWRGRMPSLGIAAAGVVWFVARALGGA